MSLQPIIAAIATHLAAQRKQALEPSSASVAINACQYRGFGNTMCAIGCLIPEALYSTDIEGAAASDFFCGPPDNAIAAHIQSLVPDVEQSDLVSFLEIAQQFHDGLRSQQSLLTAVDYAVHLWCKKIERNAGEERFSWDVLTEDYPKLLAIYKDVTDYDFAQEIARRLTYVNEVVVQWKAADGRIEPEEDGE